MKTEQEVSYNSKEQKKEPNYTVRRIGVGALIVLSSLGVWKGAELFQADADHLANPLTFSGETHNYTIQSGDGLYDAADTVAGHDTVDTRDVIDYITKIPANETPLSDGLQPGEALTVPDSVIHR